MNVRATSGMSVSAVREFGLALRSGPFRVALVLSLIAHLVLLVVLGRGGPGREGVADRRIPLMRVRILPPELLPAAIPTAPGSAVSAGRPRSEGPRRVPPRSLADR